MDKDDIVDIIKEAIGIYKDEQIYYTGRDTVVGIAILIMLSKIYDKLVEGDDDGVDKEKKPISEK